MQSEMTLHLPNLGKVQAKLRLVDGRLSIQLAAESAETSIMLNQQKQTLVHAFEQNGQVLDGLTVSSLLKAKTSAAKSAEGKKAEIRPVSLI
jgi:flagellar hook-length control protein FliK